MSDAAQARLDLAGRQLQLLGELAEIGLDIARALDVKVKAAAAEETSLADLQVAATAYARATRA